MTEAGDDANGATAGVPEVTGTLADNVTDPDAEGALTDDVDFSIGGTGTYGDLTFDSETGAWTYTLDNDNTDTQALNVTDAAVEQFTFTATDGDGASIFGAIEQEIARYTLY